MGRYPQGSRVLLLVGGLGCLVFGPQETNLCMKQAHRGGGNPAHVGRLECTVPIGEVRGIVITCQARVRVAEGPHVLGSWLGHISSRCHHTHTSDV